MTVRNNFTSKREYWISECPNYPTIYDEIRISLVKKPIDHVALIWDGTNKWVKANNSQAILIQNGRDKIGGVYKIHYLLNFQELFLIGNNRPKFKIEWEV